MDPTIVSLATSKALPGMELRPRSYKHLSGQITTFSWKAVQKLFSNVIETKALRISQATIEEQSLLRVDGSKVLRISEELSFAADLRRGSLLNSRCAEDQRLFLEFGRRPTTVQPGDLEDQVSKSLPWQSVPESSTLDIVPSDEEEGTMPAISFLFVTLCSLLLFASFLGPELLGI